MNRVSSLPTVGAALRPVFFLLIALSLLLAPPSGCTRRTPAEGTRPSGTDLAEAVVFVASDGDWPTFLEAVPAVLRYDEWNRQILRPFIAIPDLSPYTLDIETHIRDSRLVSRAEGQSNDTIPKVEDSTQELTQKIYLPTVTQRIELVQAEGLDSVTAVLEHAVSGKTFAVEKGFAADSPEGGEWLLTLKMNRKDVAKGVVKLQLRIQGWDLAVLDKFMRASGTGKIVALGKLPKPVVARLSKDYEFSRSTPFEVRGKLKSAAAVVSTSYPSALVGAHMAGMDDIPHFVHSASLDETVRKLAEAGATSVTIISDPGTDAGRKLAADLKTRKKLDGARFTVLTHEEAEKKVCADHYLADVVVVNPDDAAFPPDYSYPRSSIAAPIYAIWRRAGIVFVKGGDLRRYAEKRLFANVNFGVNGYQYGFQWDDVASTREQIVKAIARFELSTTPYMTILGGDFNVPCTFFINGAWPKKDFPKLTFPEDAVIYADASIYANLNDDYLMDAAVGRIMGNTDEITAYMARLMFRDRMEDVKKYAANKALLVFGPWAEERDKPGDENFVEETARLLKAAGGYDCTSFAGSTWGADFLKHVGESRIVFANEFGYHNAGWGWSSYAHKDYKGPEANYNTQNFQMDFDAGYCVCSSNGCATCDDKNRDNLHYGGNSIPLGLLFFRNGALGYFGMPNAALAEITTPLEAISRGLSLGEAIQKHVNDRLRDPKGGGLFGGREGWISEVPTYDSLYKTHPLLFPMAKQDALVLFGDPQAQLARPPGKEPLEMAKGAADFLIATAVKTGKGWDLTREDKESEAAYGQSNAGAAIFMVHLYRATKDAKYLECAKKTAEWIAAATEKDDDRVPGLFTGDSGKGLLYIELARETKDPKYIELADKLVRYFSADWRYKENNQPYWMTDLYAGAAGHILFLLELNNLKPDKFYLDEARRAGDFIIKYAESPAKGEFYWPMDPWTMGRDFYYTGFAHGVAGIAYCLAELYRATGDSKYLEYAEGGAKHVMEKAVPLGEGCQWYAKYTPKPDKIKFQWCHGPPGMLLMFLKLFEATKKPVYRQWAEKCAVTAAKPGKYYRMDMGLCHGTPGNGDIFIEAFRVLGDGKYLEIARDHAEFARNFAVETKDGITWRLADRSYMNGTAGVGHFFLRLADPGRTRMALIAK